ncbi:MAG: hypothetical protein ABIW32_06235 [Terrimesophilobacter sp.]
MMMVTMLYFSFILIITAGGVFLTRLGTTSGHFVALAAGAFGCVLLAAAATIAVTMTTVMVTI